MKHKYINLPKDLEAALQWASKYGHAEVVKVLLDLLSH